MADVAFEGHRSVCIAEITQPLGICTEPTAPSRWRARCSAYRCAGVIETDNPGQGDRAQPSNTTGGDILSGDELARLIKALAAHPDKQGANIIRILLLTGCRHGEALSMRWADVDFGEKGVWSKLPSSTKQREHHQTPLSAPARQLLSEIREEYISKHPKKPLGEYVFPQP